MGAWERCVGEEVIESCSGLTEWRGNKLASHPESHVNSRNPSHFPLRFYHLPPICTDIGQIIMLSRFIPRTLLRIPILPSLRALPRPTTMLVSPIPSVQLPQSKHYSSDTGIDVVSIDEVKRLIGGKDKEVGYLFAWP